VKKNMLREARDTSCTVEFELAPIRIRSYLSCLCGSNRCPSCVMFFLDTNGPLPAPFSLMKPNQVSAYTSY
jgi:hypothetical protein